MAVTDKEARDLRQDFARRRRSHRTKAALLVVLLALLAAGQRDGRIWGLPSAVALGLFVATVAYTFLSMRRVARCPACGGDLSRNMRVASCPRCGVALR